MKLVDLIRLECKVDFENIALLRHFNSIDRLLELGGTVDEFTSLQPKDTKWDFWRKGKPRVEVVVVIVHDRVSKVLQIVGIEKEGAFESLASAALRRFDTQRKGELYKKDRPTRLFTMAPIDCSAINAPISGWERREINAIVRSNANLFREIEVSVAGGRIRLADQDADGTDSHEEAAYLLQSGDRRMVVERQIRERRGQRQFRDALRARYGNCCLATGCTILAVIEAAHIMPYRGDDDNHPENGLLLRADIHTLFDLDLLGIQPDRMLIELHPRLKNDKQYRALAGQVLHCTNKQRPSRDALAKRYEQFRAGLPT